MVMNFKKYEEIMEKRKIIESKLSKALDLFNKKIELKVSLIDGFMTQDISIQARWYKNGELFYMKHIISPDFVSFIPTEYIENEGVIDEIVIDFQRKIFENLIQ